MNIICSTLISKKFESIREFKRDLGFTLTQDMKNGSGLRTVIKIKDSFVRHFNNLYGVYPNKHGMIGRIGIYIDTNISNDKIKIFDDDKEFIFEINRNIEDMRTYLSNIITSIESGEVISKDIEINTDGSIEFYVDPNLSPDEYMKEFLKQKKKMEEMNILK
jgi:hypothetical protein